MASVRRRLTAILAADVAGYSRLMGADEEGTHERLKAHLAQLVDPKIKEHRSRTVKNRANWTRSSGAGRFILVTGRPCRSPAGRSSSSMTGSPPAARYAPRFALSEGREPGKSSWRSRSHLGTRSRNCERRSTRPFA